MASLREITQEKPWVAWVAVAVLVLVAGWVLLRFTGGEASPTSVEYLTREVTIRCNETGKEWSMPRGRLEKELLLRGTPLDPSVGLTNPDTGRPTGFPVDRDEWERTIKRLNDEAARRGR